MKYLWLLDYSLVFFFPLTIFIVIVMKQNIRSNSLFVEKPVLILFYISFDS